MFGQVHTDWEKDCRHDYDERLNYVELLHRYIGAKVVKVRGYVSRHVAPAKLCPNNQQNAPGAQHAQKGRNSYFVISFLLNTRELAILGLVDCVLVLSLLR